MKAKHALWIIVIVAAAVRLYKLGIIPYGYNWDETSIIYNAWGIALWHRDEWANLMPLAFRSFGDYKSPLLFYLLAVPYMITGVVPVLIRVYSALAGIITVLCTYGIAKETFKSKIATLTAAALVAISPWAINFSRVGFEANIALSMVVIAILFLSWGIKKAVWLVPSAIFFAGSLYAYHSTKIFVPIFLSVFALVFYKKLFVSKKHVIIALLVGVICSAPLIHVTLFGGGFERGLTMIFFDQSRHLRPATDIASEFFVNLKNQFSSDFLIKGKDAVGLRHLTPGSGVMYTIELPFLLFGLWELLRRPNDRLQKFLIGWLLIGSLPALLSHQTPHAVRSLLMMPAMQLIVAWGFYRYVELVKTANVLSKKIAVAAPVCALIVGFSTYINTYYTSYAINSSYDFQYGYKEALETAARLGRTKDKIVVTDKYGQPYIYVLLQNKIKPEEFLAGALANYEFHTFGWPYFKPNAVIVGTPDEIPFDDAAVKHLVKIPGTDQVVFVIAETPKE